MGAVSAAPPLQAAVKGPSVSGSTNGYPPPSGGHRATGAPDSKEGGIREPRSSKWVCLRCPVCATRAARSSKFDGLSNYVLRHGPNTANVCLRVPSIPPRGGPLQHGTSPGPSPRTFTGPRGPSPHLRSNLCSSFRSAGSSFVQDTLHKSRRHTDLSLPGSKCRQTQLLGQPRVAVSVPIVVHDRARLRC
ncbi:hypothetical protein NDU88_005543 [Pleurodeles waltl]|uniref:Uncharacterized protein n=1 Tax=Pleurodeles waltl TaxID=8319 RepID=A0AAV7UKC7_PLEWA|nr:hypothetical protein NDU88_005543 [Pleurodeles waltl]